MKKHVTYICKVLNSFILEFSSFVDNFVIFFQVVLDTIHIFVRTATFTPLIIYQPHQAVVAFSVAQVRETSIAATSLITLLRRIVAMLGMAFSV